MATVVLLQVLAGVAADSGADLAVGRNSFPTLHAALALLLVVVVVVATYKPRGMARYGWRKRQEQRRRHNQRTVPVRWKQRLTGTLAGWLQSGTK